MYPDDDYPCDEKQLVHVGTHMCREANKKGQTPNAAAKGHEAKNNR